MPDLRPFRALRFNAAVTDLSAVLSPPYDIISPAERLALLEQDPYNAVRIELPADVGSATAADYQRAAETAASWRRDGILVKDAEPTITLHRMSWQEADGRRHSSTGFLARLKLEEFGPGSGVLPHERTLSGPKQDRYELLEATQINTSPLVFLAGSDAEGTARLVAELSQGPADAEATTNDGVRHELWVHAGSEPGVAALLELVSSAPITIADGHHRYETALTYRDDQRARSRGDEDPASDYVMALVYDLADAPPALPTHRVLRGEPTGLELLDRLTRFFAIDAVGTSDQLLAAMSETPAFTNGATGTSRIGLAGGGSYAILTVDHAAVDAALDPALSTASRGLDVNALTAAVESIYGAEPGRLAGEGHLWYVKDAAEAVAQVQSGRADSCFLLDLMPAEAITRVAEAGEVMPQKSTYFHPKAPTGLAFSPLEW